MIDKEIYDYCKSIKLENNILILPEEIFNALTYEQANFIKEYFPQNTLFRLPSKEIEFFEWLKINDEKVWLDLWNDDLNSPYIVSLGFLPLLVKQGYRGFPICDLNENDNYYFVPKHLADKESQIFTESAKTIYMNKGEMTLPQLLAMEISLDPIDIWHFAYKHKTSLKESKKAVLDLVKDDILVHLKEASYLTTFIEL